MPRIAKPMKPAQRENMGKIMKKVSSGASRVIKLKVY